MAQRKPRNYAKIVEKHAQKWLRSTYENASSNALRPFFSIPNKAFLGG